MTKVFITGATGYIGGDALYEIVNAHPDWEITCLVRNTDKGSKIAAQYPRVKLVYGDLDSSALIEEQASLSDIVYHFADCDHEASAEAITKGLAKKQGSPSFWIHTSGTLILAWESMDQHSFGYELPKVYNDWELINELVSQPDSAAHRNVDKIVLAASQEHPDKIKTAIVCPPTIYGVGRGPDNQRSVQVYRSAEAFMKAGKAFKVNKGQNIWHSVHVQDLSKLYLLLGEAAVAGGPPATWNDQGYYLAENGPFVWGEILQVIADEAFKRGFLPSKNVVNLSPESAEELMSRARFSIGTNSRGNAIRAKKLLGWEPKENSIFDEVPTIVEGEARRLDILQGHAAKVEQ